MSKVWGPGEIAEGECDDDHESDADGSESDNDEDGEAEKHDVAEEDSWGKDSSWNQNEI